MHSLGEIGRVSGSARRSIRYLKDHAPEWLARVTVREGRRVRHRREDAPAALAKRLDAMPLSVRQTTRVPVGTYHGLQFGLLLHPQFSPDVYLEGAGIRHTGLSREHQGPRAVLNGLERLAGAYSSECVGTRQELAIANPS
jgi:hypothetical protein